MLYYASVVLYKPFFWPMVMVLLLPAPPSARNLDFERKMNDVNNESLTTGGYAHWIHHVCLTPPKEVPEIGACVVFLLVDRGPRSIRLDRLASLSFFQALDSKKSRHFRST